jgi:HlyD family secretion protein
MVPLAQALGDHSDEGVAILSAEPWRVLHGLVYTVIAMVLTGLAWSFIGRADVIVAAQGALEPDSEVRRFYAEVDGELANLFVAVGQPVSKGDVLARLNARGAVQAASNSLQAHLKLENAEREWREFPEKKALLERKAATQRQAMELEEQQHQQRLSVGTSQVVAVQRAQQAESRNAVQEARHSRDAARAELDKFERVFATPGGGGVSRLQLDTKRNALASAESNFARQQLQQSELVARHGQEITRTKAEIETSGETLKKLRLDYEAATTELRTAEEKVRLQLQQARVEAEAAARIRFDNLDKDNFLQIVAPVSGVITELTSTQPGDKVQANTPLGGIAPGNARMVVKIEIAEQDRAFLHEGQPVKLKFSAFPYQRYGVINGTLESIAPATKSAPQTKLPVYEGRVSIQRDHVVVADTRYPLRYGMTATAEVVVRARRLIDLALDPFRQIGG